MNFLSYLYRKYKISKEKEQLNKDMQQLTDDFKRFDGDSKKLDKKYGNFGRAWALLQGRKVEIIQKENDL